jgi:hypothetical protein
MNLYRNNLKNGDFGQEAPRRFDPEQATIAQEARRKLWPLESGSKSGSKSPKNRLKLFY